MPKKSKMDSSTRYLNDYMEDYFISNTTLKVLGYISIEDYMQDREAEQLRLEALRIEYVRTQYIALCLLISRLAV